MGSEERTRVADIADVVVTRTRRIANLVTVKEIEESLHDLRVWSRYKGRLKAWFEGMRKFLELDILFLFVDLFIYLNSRHNSITLIFTHLFSCIYFLIPPKSQLLHRYFTGLNHRARTTFL